MNSLVAQYSRPAYRNEGYSDQEQDEISQITPPLSLRFAMPPIANPSSFLRAVTDDYSNPNCPIKLAHGTTTLAFRFQGGIIVATDSRATAGDWIASQTVKKVIEINNCLLGTMAGGAADCQYWLAYLGMQCRLHELRHKRRISVAAASKILSNLVYSYKGMGLSMGTMCAGVTPQEGPALYYIDSDGTRLAGNLFCVGSGQTFAYGVLDAEYHYDLSEEDALQLGRRSILAATHRDAFSGGFINLYHVKEDGWVKHGFNVRIPNQLTTSVLELTHFPGHKSDILEDEIGKGGVFKCDIAACISWTTSPAYTVFSASYPALKGAGFYCSF
ncbi:MAG: hypothetical protein Q9172_006443 [Xanthocarpia lactea]